ncbi:BURP domain protein USPL1-like [Tripterygium wilfordii]|uniref:BURP domain protein USPL1-like n=1 Tax=Tripterygium wilfordii TaxID=458696 RepID=UPI0018F7F0DA|nr:BURP domain protein USPL1-like [Tripterygium wilfordii]
MWEYSSLVLSLRAARACRQTCGLILFPYTCKNGLKWPPHGNFCYTILYHGKKLILYLFHPQISKAFSIPQGSPHAKAMEDTIRRCETLPMEGEAKTCANSPESLLDFVNTTFGQNSYVKALTTTHDAMPTGNSNKYGIMEVKEIPIRKMMGCHVMRWPYAVYYCHHQIDNSETKVFKILLGGDDDGDKLDAFTACHMDTLKRDPNQLVFKLLNTALGRSSPAFNSLIGNIALLPNY